MRAEPRVRAVHTLLCVCVTACCDARYQRCERIPVRLIFIVGGVMQHSRPSKSTPPPFHPITRRQSVSTAYPRSCTGYWCFVLLSAVNHMSALDSDRLYCLRWWLLVCSQHATGSGSVLPDKVTTCYGDDAWSGRHAESSGYA